MPSAGRSCTIVPVTMRNIGTSWPCATGGRITVVVTSGNAVLHEVLDEIRIDLIDALLAEHYPQGILDHAHVRLGLITADRAGTG